MFSSRTIVSILMSLWLSNAAFGQVVPLPGTSPEYLRKGSESIADIQKVVPEGKLPGKKIPYYVKAEEGQRYLVGGTVINFMSRANDSGGLFELMTITGGKGSGQGIHTHSKHHVALYMMEGEADLWLDGKHYWMNRGDFASVPENVAYGFRFAAHRTKMLAWYSGTGVLPMYQALGEPTEAFVQPEVSINEISKERVNKAEAVSDVKFLKQKIPEGRGNRIANATLPAGKVPFVLAADEGTRFVSGSEMFAFLAKQENTGGKFFVVMSQGTVSPMIALHYHELHSETFLALEGQVSMKVNDTVLTLNPGDFAAVPARTIHAYKMDSPFTRFMGFLTPGVFQNFFTTIGEPDYKGHVYPQKAYPLRIDRVIKNLDKLDLHLLDKPAN